MGKGQQILSELAKANMIARGHKVLDHSEDCAIAVWGINVPMLSDCREIARQCGVELKVEPIFDMVIFRWR